MVLVTGPNLEKAMWLAFEFETLCRQYYQILLIGGLFLATMIGNRADEVKSI